jgi:type III secretion protein C
MTTAALSSMPAQRFVGLSAASLSALHASRTEPTLDATVSDDTTHLESEFSPMFPMTRFVALIAAAVLATATPVCSAAAGPWANKKFSYRAEGKKLTEVLQDFGASQSVPVVIDASIDGKVNGSFDVMPEEFLKTIEKTYGVVWYFDGVSLFVYPSRAVQSKVFRLRGFDKVQVQQSLKSLGLGDPRFALRYDDGQQTLLAYGPPRHIELIATVIDSLEQGRGDRVDETVRVVPLRFASAADRMSGSTRIAGLASTLTAMFQQARGAAAPPRDLDAGPSVLSPGKRKSLERMYGMNDSQADRDRERERQSEAAATKKSLLGGDDKAGREDASPQRSGAGADDRPYFQADESSNSIIVHSASGKIKQYEDLIRQLDVPQDMVEIEATIIDISSDEIEELGIDWQFSRTGKGSITVSPVDGGTSGNQPFGTLVGSNITTVVADAGRALLSRIRALEGKGKARIVSRPKVLGAANRTATMADKRTASVRVAGNLDANLFAIEAGTAMQVVPQIQNFAGWSEVRMSLFIEDGNFLEEQVDKIPVVRRTEIRTEATVREGQSLLIGGISVESESRSKSGIPVLSRIPVLGLAFSQDRTTAVKSERLFLLTPKVIRAAVAPPVVPPVGLAAPSQPVAAAAPVAPVAPVAPSAPVAPERLTKAPMPPAPSPAPAECTAQFIALGLGPTRCGALR